MNDTKKVPMRPFPTKKQRQLERGQSLTIAVIVLFLLLFLAGLFIVLVVNNLRDSKTSSQRSQSNKYAQAGLNYLDEELLKSAEGADWRARPDCDFNVVPCGKIAQNDPDYFWLQPIVIDSVTSSPKVDASGNVIGGYTRIPFDGGRALVRVSYRPHYVAASAADKDKLDPTSKYIKLESIGRVGSIEGSDPTTFGRTESKGMRNELYAFKQIGLTDYLWQVTNKDGKASSVGLGVTRRAADAPTNPDGTRPQPATNGADVDNNGVITNATLNPQAHDIESVFYGPVRINAGLDFYGKSRFFLDSRRNDAIEVAGAIRVQNGGLGLVQDNANPAVNGPIQSSNGTLPFNTYGGLVRDNPRGTDTTSLGDLSGNANLRSISATTAPVIDNLVGSGDLTRYRLLTRNASALPQAVALGDNAGKFGWGTGMYIPNKEDLQQASLTLGGAYSLRADWLNPNPDRFGAKSYWQTSSRYIPPAVQIELFPRYMKITRYDKATTNYLFDATGNPIGDVTIVRYTPVNAQPAPTLGVSQKLEGYPATLVAGTKNLYEGDYTVFAEGNVRIKGTLGGLDPETAAYFLRHLTVVSGGTIYIDGNLLRDNISPGDAANGIAGDPDPHSIRGKSSLALLAKDYVCVNTTQFLSPLGGTPTKEDVGSSVPEAYLLERDSSGTTRKEINVQFSAAPVELFKADGSGIAGLSAPSYFGSQLTAQPQFVMLRQSSTGDPLVPANQGPAPINVLLNSTDLFGGPANNPTTSLISNPRGTVDGTGNPVRSQSGEYQNDVAGISTPPLGAGVLATRLGVNNQLTIAYDQDSGASEPKNYRNSRVGVVPLDIRIEALMYAQEGSFFVIPWFNPDPNDTYERFVVKGNRRAGDSDLVAAGTPRVDPRFPFYGEPMDIRLTVFGGITQNVSAEVGDQTEWMLKWGWVPNHYGSTGLANAALPGAPVVPAVQTAHGRLGIFPGPLNSLAAPAFTGPNGSANSAGSGLLYLFDDRMIAPYGVTGTTTGPLRPSPYNPTEPLPIAPNLPVAPGLLYKGENPIR